MIEHSTDITKLAEALHAAQGQLSGVKKDSKNPHFKTKYASLEAVIDEARPALQASNISFTQAPGAIVDGAIEITAMLMHVSGQWIRSTLHVPIAKKDPQGVGSAITYGCRYSLMAALGMPPVDDDAESAMQRGDDQRRSKDDRPAERSTAPDERREPTSSATVYVQKCRPKIQALTTPEAVDRWWREGLRDRDAHGIAKGDTHYTALASFCADHKRLLARQPDEVAA